MKGIKQIIGGTIEDLRREHEWIFEAEIKDAVIDISNGLKFVSGVWEDGVWRYGRFSGEWRVGMWLRGIFYGTWHNGEWNKGTFHGTWNNGLWHYGTISKGVWNGGVFARGYVENSEINGGVFEFVSAETSSFNNCVVLDAVFYDCTGTGGVAFNYKSLKNGITGGISAPELESRPKPQKVFGVTDDAEIEEEDAVLIAEGYVWFPVYNITYRREPANNYFTKKEEAVKKAIEICETAIEKFTNKKEELTSL